MARFRASHGTDGGYYRHRRAKLVGDDWSPVACDPCLDAHAEYERKRIEQKTGRRPEPKRRKQRCPLCGRRAHLHPEGICPACHQWGAPEEFAGEWRNVGGILMPVRETA